MPHGLVVTNCAVDFAMLEQRQMGARYRHAPRIAAATQPSNHAAMSVEIGDALFRMPGSEKRMLGVPRSVPSCLVFSSFNLLTEKEANDAVFMGVARNRVRPKQGQNTDNPVFAGVVHGMQAMLNNGPHAIQAGDIVIAEPPDVKEGDRQLGDARRGAPQRISTAGNPGARVVAVTKSMRSSYSPYFGKYGNSLPHAYAAGCEDVVTPDEAKNLVAQTRQEPAAKRVYTMVRPDADAVSIVDDVLRTMNLNETAHKEDRPFTALQPILYAELQQYMQDLTVHASRALRVAVAGGGGAEQKAPDEDGLNGTTLHERLVAELIERLTRIPTFLAYAKFAFATNDPVSLTAILTGMATPYHIFTRGPMLISRLIVDHIDFMRTYYATKTVGKAMAQAPPNGTLHVYVTPGAAA